MKSNLLSPLTPVDPVWRTGPVPSIPTRPPVEEDVMEERSEALYEDEEVVMEAEARVVNVSRGSEDDLWDDLQRRHVKLMRDITYLDGRLREAALQVSGVT